MEICPELGIRRSKRVLAERGTVSRERRTLREVEMLRIRLRRGGAKNRPFYRLVVSEGAMQPKGRFLETLGIYDPVKKIASLRVNWERFDHWVQKGANPSETVKRLLKKARTTAS